MSQNREDEYRTIGKAVWEYYRKMCLSKVAGAVKRGDMASPIGLPCADCGRPASIYEHRNYARPLDVRPVCDSCNYYSGAAELLPEVVVSHLANSDYFPFENKRLRLMEKSRWREECACCETGQFTHSQKYYDYLLTIF